MNYVLAILTAAIGILFFLLRRSTQNTTLKKNDEQMQVLSQAFADLTKGLAELQKKKALIDKQASGLSPEQIEKFYEEEADKEKK